MKLPRGVTMTGSHIENGRLVLHFHVAWWRLAFDFLAWLVHRARVALGC